MHIFLNQIWCYRLVNLVLYSFKYLLVMTIFAKKNFDVKKRKAIQE